MQHFKLFMVASCLIVQFMVTMALAHYDMMAEIITNFTGNVLNGNRHTVVFGCNRRRTIQHVVESSMRLKQFVRFIDLRFNYSMQSILTHTCHTRTTAIVDCACNGSRQLLMAASDGKYVNKTYQWLLWDDARTRSADTEGDLLANIKYLGPNAQLTYVNCTSSDALNCSAYTLWDVHSKGRHLNAPLQLQRLASHANGTLTLHQSITYLQGMQSRDQFDALTLRGATVIDRDDITDNEQIELILDRPMKDSGVAAFTKYHYALVLLLRHRLNFTVNFRNARGWAGRLGDTRFRLGFLGIMARNEADIGASAAFNRINRFAEFDIIHQSWKFETAFLYRFTSDLDTGHGSSGNFLAPFDNYVWWSSASIMLITLLIWFFTEHTRNRKDRVGKATLSSLQREDEQQQAIGWISACPDRIETTISGLSLSTFAAICQQGIDPIPNGWPSRTIILNIFLFSLLMYNYYTSSVVGGLLSSNVNGPSTVDEIVSSKLKLSFEDIGYYKVLFRENKTPTIRRLISRKVEPSRDPRDLPLYTHINEAIPYLRIGQYAFHCEIVDAYPEIAKEFNANEICELRAVTGLLETEVMNFIVAKNSQYTELFRIVILRLKEIGIIQHLLHERQPKKPLCQAFFTVYSVNLSGVMSAFFILGGGMLFGLITLIIEINFKKICYVVVRNLRK